jgi:hemerythrin-like domain-containing protein
VNGDVVVYKTGEQHMQARGQLMIEHRLIEQMISIIQDTLPLVEEAQKIDPLFIDKAVDFIRIYADRTHHGKEEEILFRALNDKDLSDEDRRVMNELVKEHDFGRKNIKALIKANTLYRNGRTWAFGDIKNCLRAFVDFYPKHIEKEDKVFFPASRAYFSDAEDQAMLAEFWEFDRKMIHEKYRSVVHALKEK